MCRHIKTCATTKEIQIKEWERVGHNLITIAGGNRPTYGGNGGSNGGKY